MSHYSVLVCLPADTPLLDLEKHLDAVMARWDENRAVPRYRDYEEGDPAAYWWVGSLRRDREGLMRMQKDGREATRERLIDEFRAKASDWERETPEEKVDKEIADFEWSERFDLGQTPTWAQVAEAYNAKWHPGNEVATTDDDSDSERLLIDEDGRAYTWSTRNPEAKWDYWRIGGRWREYFVARENGAGLVTSKRSWDSPPEGPVLDRLRVDGGPVGLLDFATMRDERAERDLRKYDRWQEIVAEHGAPPAWRDLYGLVDLKEIDIEEARRRYNTHPAIRAAREAEIDTWDQSIEEAYGTSREEFERLARLAAVPGYALVTLDGEWKAPGRMGWFGMSSDEAGEREGYWLDANAYLEALDPGVLVVALDCHI